MPFLGSSAAGDYRVSKAQAGIQRDWATTNIENRKVFGYPIRVLGMDKLIATAVQLTGTSFATVSVRVTSANFPTRATEAAGAWIVLSTQTITALNTPLVFQLTPIAASWAQVYVEMIDADPASTGIYTIGAIA